MVKKILFFIFSHSNVIKTIAVTVLVLFFHHLSKDFSDFSDRKTFSTAYVMEA